MLSYPLPHIGLHGICEQFLTCTNRAQILFALRGLLRAASIGIAQFGQIEQQLRRHPNWSQITQPALPPHLDFASPQCQQWERKSTETNETITSRGFVLNEFKVAPGNSKVTEAIMLSLVSAHHHDKLRQTMLKHLHVIMV
jgi:hypothetical protein